MPRTIKSTVHDLSPAKGLLSLEEHSIYEDGPDRDRHPQGISHQLGTHVVDDDKPEQTVGAEIEHEAR